MADIDNRTKIEAEFRNSLMPVFRSAQKSAASGSDLNYTDLAVDIAGAAEESIRKAHVAIFLLLMSQEWVDFSGMQLMADQMAASYSSNAAAAIGKTVADNIRNDLASGTLPDVVFDVNRADRIAQTEVTRAVTSGGKQAKSILASTGKKLIARWRVQEVSPGKPDDRVDDICRPLNRLLEPEWRQIYNGMPPRHVNCRCYVDYIPSSELEQVK